MTIYDVRFLKNAQKEWDRLSYPVQRQFQKKLEKIRAHPRIPSAKLSGMPDCYKIKLRKEGFRLVYRVFDDRVVVQIIAIGRRDGPVYGDAQERAH